MDKSLAVILDFAREHIPAVQFSIIVVDIICLLTRWLLIDPTQSSSISPIFNIEKQTKIYIDWALFSLTLAAVSIVSWKVGKWFTKAVTKKIRSRHQKNLLKKKLNKLSPETISLLFRIYLDPDLSYEMLYTRTHRTLKPHIDILRNKELIYLETNNYNEDLKFASKIESLTPSIKSHFKSSLLRPNEDVDQFAVFYCNRFDSSLILIYHKLKQEKSTYEHQLMSNSDRYPDDDVSSWADTNVPSYERFFSSN